MRIAIFCHSLRSDWNHGNAHFLRGIASELLSRGHEVRVYEPENGWSASHLLAEGGEQAFVEFQSMYPGLHSIEYSLDSLDLDFELEGVELVLVHEWNDPALIQALGDHRQSSGTYRLLFHDTHHRSVTEREKIAACDLSSYDGILAFGRVIRDLYLAQGWTERAWTWHEAADTRVFRPLLPARKRRDLVWIGNWGDEERTAELHDFLLEPVRRLNLEAEVYGVRYPDHAVATLRNCGIGYGGWLPNYRVPQVFAESRATIHIPRRPYVDSLPGIPTIRVFEALACGIPLVCSPWSDVEGLFTPGEDYLLVGDTDEMTACLSALLRDESMAQQMAAHGRRTILARHTCRHRVDELLRICQELEVEAAFSSAHTSVPIGEEVAECGAD